MDITIPFVKEIPFKENISDICSISLEEDVSINEKELLGDFIISGDYKNLDINIDTKPFEHVIPFSVSLKDDIDINSLTYKVVDFTYEYDKNILSVNIELNVKADELTRLDVNNIFVKDESSDVIDSFNTISENISNNHVNTVVNNDEDIVNNNYISDLEDDYITYHVHLVKVNETIDSISNDYNISKEEILKINDIKDITIGEKLVIPIEK